MSLRGPLPARLAATGLALTAFALGACTSTSTGAPASSVPTAVSDMAEAGADEPVEIAAEGTWEHPSGVLFPLRLGEFTRTRIVELPGTEGNHSVSYLGAETGTLVTAHVYPAGEGSLDVHYAAAVARVRQAQRNLSAYAAKDVTLTLEGVDRPGKVGSFEWTERRDGRRVALRSHAYVFVAGDWVVEYRTTGPKAVDEDAQARVRGLVQAIGFPGTTGPGY